MDEGTYRERRNAVNAVRFRDPGDARPRLRHHPTQPAPPMASMIRHALVVGTAAAALAADGGALLAQGKGPAGTLVVSSMNAHTATILK